MHDCIDRERKKERREEKRKKRKEKREKILEDVCCIYENSNSFQLDHLFSFKLLFLLSDTPRGAGHSH